MPPNEPDGYGRTPDQAQPDGWSSLPILQIAPDGTISYLFEGSVEIPASLVPTLGVPNLIRWIDPEGGIAPGETVGSVGVVAVPATEASGQFRVVNPLDPAHDFALLELEVTAGGAAVRIRTDEGGDSSGGIELITELGSSEFARFDQSRISTLLKASLVWPGGVTSFVTAIPHGLAITPSGGLVSSFDASGVGAHSVGLDGADATNINVRIWTIGGGMPLAGTVTPVTVLAIE